MEWRESDGVRWLQASLDGAGAAFSTRLGGVSEAPFDSLNLGLLTADDGEAVGENHRRLAAALGFEPGQIVFARQVHGARLVEHPRAGSLVEADGHVLREAGTAALVFTADCLPIAVAGPKGMAMLHAGWRGLAGGILGAGVEAVEATSAAIGPGIGPCCYEVGEEVLESFANLGEGVAKGRMLDLPEVARRLLAAAGVERVESAGLCTSCEADLFFSHRRDHGRTGRQGGVGWVEAG
jgi:YfiH family protein